MRTVLNLEAGGVGMIGRHGSLRACEDVEKWPDNPRGHFGEDGRFPSR